MFCALDADITKTFSVLKRIPNGGMERVTLARFPAMTVEQARKKAADVLGKIATGDNPGEIRRAIREEPTFGELFTEYGKRHGSKKRSWRDDQQRYRDYLEKPLGKIKVGALTTGMIDRILMEMERRGKANSTINGVLALASVIYSKGAEPGQLGTNPARGIARRNVKSRDRFLQKSELPRFFASLAEEQNTVVRDYFLISLLTGARRSNVLAMRWSEVNLDEGLWRIPRTKNELPQNVTLATEAITLLAELKAQADSKALFVFPGEGRSGHLVEPKKGWQRVLDRDELHQLEELLASSGHLSSEPALPTDEDSLAIRLARARERSKELVLNTEGARMEDLRIHDLRRTLGSWQAKNGASLAIIGKSLNHKDIKTTLIYSRLDLDPVRDSVDSAVSSMFAAGIKNPKPEV